ncbi:MAG: hypothetical protein N2749_00280 [Clostridia bacterium]|nr:hypothetical protein [Clostridia bacterium]
MEAELQLHYTAYKFGFAKNRSRIADMGTYKKGDGYDNNAWLFQAFGILY